MSPSLTPCGLAAGMIYINVDPQTIFIGHSVGASFALSCIEALNLPIRAAFFVSGFLGLLNNEKFDELNQEFTTRQFNWDKIKKNVQEIYVYHSDNDPYVPVKKAYELADKLGVKPIIIRGAGHFNELAGYLWFPELLADIRNIE